MKTDRGTPGAMSDVDIWRALRVARFEPQKDWPERIVIDPFNQDNIQPASVDLRLGSDFKWFPGHRQYVDMRDRKVEMVSKSASDPSWDPLKMEGDVHFALKPGGFVLGTTLERIELGPKIVGKVEGKSSLGRIGLTAHITAGFIDPGFNGQITLELFNASPNTILLRPGLPICQIAFFECITTCDRPYGSKGLGSRYQGQKGATAVKP